MRKVGLFSVKHVLKSENGSLGCSTVLTSFERDKSVIFGSDEFEKLKKPAFVPLPVFQSSGLGVQNWCDFGEEFFPDVRRVDKHGASSEFSIWEIILCL